MADGRSTSVACRSSRQSYLEVASVSGNRARGLRASTLNNNGRWKENSLSLARQDHFGALYWRSLTFSQMVKGKC